MRRYVIAILIALFAGSQYGPVLANFLKQHGKIALEDSLELRNLSLIGTEGCRLLYADQVSACEDLEIIGDDAILACGDGQARLHFWPGMGSFNTAGRKDFNEQVYKLNLKTLALTKLERIDQPEVVLNHGMGHWVSKDGIRLFFVNHGLDQSCIDIYDMQGDTLDLVRHVCHPGIRTPNDVAASGPLSFYITNDHKFRKGYARYLEDSYGKLKSINTQQTNL